MYFVAKYDDVEASIIKQEDGFIVSIPLDPANRDYQDYLAWVAEGNEAEPWA